MQPPAMAAVALRAGNPRCKNPRKPRFCFHEQSAALSRPRVQIALQTAGV